MFLLPPSAPRTRLTPVAATVGLLFAGALAIGAQASAQQAEAQPRALKEITVSAKAEAAYAAKSSTTATKTDTLLRDTPQAVTVVTAELMRDQAMQNLADVVRYVPGVGTAQGEGNRDTAVFRGNSSTSDFYVDGIRDDVQYYRDFYNIDSVEALKGSNAMIFGRGGAGGVINRVSKQAGWTPAREVSLSLGAWDAKRITADVGHVVSDSVALRVNTMAEHSGSYRDGVTVERKGIHPTVTIRAGRNTGLVLGYEHFQDQRVADRGVTSYGGRPYPTAPSTFFGNAELSPTWSRMNALTGMLEHDFGNGLSLRNRFRLADYDKFYQNVFASTRANPAAGTVGLGAYSSATERTNLFNQTDLFYTVETGGIGHKLVAGLELGRQETDSLRRTGTSADGGLTARLDNPVARGPVVFAAAPGDANHHGVASVASVYVQDQMTLSPSWQLVAGLRYDRFAVDYHSYAVPAAHVEVTDTPLSPRAGLVYKPREAVSVYASYSIAYVPRAGEQLGSLTLKNAVFEPEKFKNVELGAKWDLGPDLAASAAVYRLDRGNVVIASPAGAGASILVDGQTSKGVELGLSGKLGAAWSIMGGYAYQDARLANNTNAHDKTLTGKTLAMVPKHTFSLWNRYQLDDQWAAGLGLSYRDSIYASVDNSVTLPSYARVDVALFYKLDQHYRLQANVENLLDKQYYAAAHSNFNITPGSPRALRVTLHATF